MDNFLNVDKCFQNNFEILLKYPTIFKNYIYFLLPIKPFILYFIE